MKAESAKFYQLYSVSEAVHSRGANGLEFQFKIKCSPSFEKRNFSEMICTRDPKLIMPKKKAIEFLRCAVSHLEHFSKGHSLFTYAQDQLKVLRKFCVKHKYNLRQVMGQKYGSVVLTKLKRITLKIVVTTSKN